MLLKDLIKNLNIIEEKNPQGDLDIRGIANHTNHLGQGFLYVAIKGYITDGHLYIKKAIENGAVAIIVEEISQEFDIAQYKVENSRIALSQISSEFYGHPSKDMRLIGVTATNGKTTTTYMLNSIFEKARIPSGLVGSVVVKVGRDTITSDLTTPESVDLQRYLYMMKNRGIEKVAMEVSSSALELFRTHDVDYDILAFNNFSREHIDQHGSFERYWEVKSSFIKNAKEGSFVVLNLDDQHSKSLIKETKGQVITYSLTKKEGNIYCQGLDLSSGRAEFTVVVNEEFINAKGILVKGKFKVRLGVPGYHSVANSMAAITISLIEGIPVEYIRMGLREFTGVERRFQYIYENDFVIIDDHFANRGNINVSLETLKYMKYNKLHLVYAIRGNRGVTVNRENAETMAKWKDRLNIDSIIATKSIGDVTFRDKVSPEEEEVFLDAMKEAHIGVAMYDSLKEAIGTALDKVGEGDIVLLAGCQGMDHGAKVALNILKDTRLNLDEEELFKVLEDRVV